MLIAYILSPLLRMRCRRSLSQRVATHNQRVLGEQDALAEEVRFNTSILTALCSSNPAVLSQLISFD
jgi:hypothetical protein